MKTTNSIRIDSSLYASATEVASVMKRSAAQQVVHWARLGRELETSQVSSTRIRQLLDGALGYDKLSDEEQAVARTHWADKMAVLAEGLRLDREFSEQEQAYVELDDSGKVVRREPETSQRRAAVI